MGKYVFMINEGNTVIQRPSKAFGRPGPATPPGPVTQSGFLDWPGDPIRKMDWTHLDR